jgi:hypothetical protein
MLVRRAVLIVASLVLVVGLAPTTASARAVIVTRSDGNDARGPLDLASATARYEFTKTKFTIETLSAFSNKQVNGDNGFFEIDIDTNADRKANYFVLVFYASGRMRGVLLHGNGDLVTRNLTATRGAGNRVSVTVSRLGLARPDSYDFGIFSVYLQQPCTNNDPCVDSIPNRYPLLRMDYTAPTVKWTQTPVSPATGLTETVGFTVTDDEFGTGVAGWVLQKRRWGTEQWIEVAEGTTKNVTKTFAPGGGSWEIRVVAEDRRGNAAPSGKKHFAMPWDDADGQIVYGNVWTADTSVTGMFAETSHVGTQGATLNLTMLTGSQLCILGGPSSGPDATAAVTIDDVDVGTFTETGATAVGGQVFCTSELPASGSMTVELEVQTLEPVTIDALYVLGTSA